MSRNKKSRKQGPERREVVKESSRTVVAPVARKPKKKTGNQPGNRQKEAFAHNKKQQGPNSQKDPRIGSKTLIDLTPTVVVKKEIKPKKEKQTPIAAIRVAEPVKTEQSVLEQELHLIEEDAKLQTILVLQEDDTELTEEQIDYFNEKMDRHQQLRELLGWNDEEEEESNTSTSADSEDDLWNKLDNNDLSDYE